MQTNLFVTGTDTEIGKTFISCALLEKLKADGVRAVGYKPIAAGATLRDGELVNEDAEQLQLASARGFSLRDVNPVCLRSPIAPHLAAKSEGVAIHPDHLLTCYRSLASRADRVIVEGVGGFRVPLSDQFDTADLAVKLALPVILVVGLRLGCINHALLTAEAIMARGLTLYGWVGNEVMPAMAALDGNIATLKDLIPAPCLGIVPRIINANPSECARHLRLA